MTLNFEKALHSTLTTGKTVFTSLGELIMGTETDAGYKIKGSYNNLETTNKDREICGIFTNNKKSR